MKKVCKTEGFTLVELSVSILATAILVLTAGAILHFTIRAIQRQMAMADMQGDIRVAVPTLYQLAREAHKVDVTAPVAGSTGTVFTVSSNSIYRANGSVGSLVANASGTNLVYERGAGNKLVLSKGLVSAFSIRNATNYMIFSLTLTNTSMRDSMQVDGSIFFRN
jgi:hypothetical protein